MGQPIINDFSRTRTRNDFKQSTSLNHRIQFHVHEGFKADELVYIEVESAWAGARRAEVGSRIFTGEGRLVASCIQEAYYVLKEGEGREKGKL